MGALDCISSAMQIFAVNFITNASILVLLQQSARLRGPMRVARAASQLAGPMPPQFPIPIPRSCPKS